MMNQSPSAPLVSELRKDLMDNSLYYMDDAQFNLWDIRNELLNECNNIEDIIDVRYYINRTVEYYEKNEWDKYIYIYI